jgi:hypothetical protein
LIIHGAQETTREHRLLGAIPRLNRQLLSCAQRFDDFLQVDFRHREQHRNGSRLRDYDEAVGVAWPDQVAGIDLTQAEPSGNGSVDSGVIQLAARVVDLRLIGCDRGLTLLPRVPAAFPVLLRDQVFFLQWFQSFQVVTRGFQLRFVLAQLRFHLGEANLVGGGIDLG